MALHIIKLAVGADDIEGLSQYVRRSDRVIVHTRQTPKRAEEILEGGSHFWVIKGQILVRQRIIGIETLGVKGMTRCEIELDKQVNLTAPTPRRAFQGWRYLTEADAPPDLETSGEGAVPSALAAELRALGAW
jgi:hypothetical protein